MYSRKLVKAFCKNGHLRVREELYPNGGCRLCKHEWRKQNPEKHRSQQAKYRKDHPDRDRDKALKWAKKNPEKVMAKRQRRRTAVAGSGGSFTGFEWKKLCAKYAYRCLCCNRRVKLTADHVIPVSKGGSSNIANIQPLCKPCNSRKRTCTTDFRKLRRDSDDKDVRRTDAGIDRHTGKA